ncbi:MAG TPA: pentapeptide repeat-containing protein [Candidatus Kapabacteria bacterium]|nr:pentapeptide repeat-containing protein [Candidatus Kapabacteria bacterium]
MPANEKIPESLFFVATEFEGVTFQGETAIALNLSDRKFIDCVFERCQLSSVKLDGAVIQARFSNSKIEGINFFTAKRSLISLGFDSCLIRHSSFAELKLPKIKFTGCELHNVDFSDADLSGADFSNATFKDCVFRNTNLSKADFRYASGYFIDPTQNKIRGAHFSSPEVLSLLAPFEIEIG